MFSKYNPKNHVKVEGKMSEQGADKAGLKLATAANVAAWLFGTAAVIAAVGMALKVFFI